MKIFYYISFCIFASTLASCNESGHVDCELKVKVAQNDGSPVADADVSVRYAVGIKVNPGGGFPTDRNETSRTTTNELGEAILNYRPVSGPEGLLWIRKDNYYTSIYEEFSWEKIDGNLRNRRAEIEAILKPIKNPIPMRASLKTDRIWIPWLDVEYGYDLMKDSPMHPLGNGEHADFTLKVTGKYIDMNSNDLKLEIHFPNPHDGVVEFLTPQRLSMTKPHMEGSEFISDYESPKDGYVNKIERFSRKLPSEAKKTTDANPHRNFYFRIRTKLDANGNVESAYYGKIYGDFDFAAGNFAAKRNFASLKWISTYLNPTPNDRNVEFDPKRNLNPEGNVQRP